MMPFPTNRSSRLPALASRAPSSKPWHHAILLAVTMLGVHSLHQHGCAIRTARVCAPKGCRSPKRRWVADSGHPTGALESVRGGQAPGALRPQESDSGKPRLPAAPSDRSDVRGGRIVAQAGGPAERRCCPADDEHPQRYRHPALKRSPPVQAFLRLTLPHRPDAGCP
jgi:hypothetical protein